MLNYSTIVGRFSLRPNPVVGGADLPAEFGLRRVFLGEFQQENFTLFQVAKLRNRTQGTANYNYDVLDLCRIVNPVMTDANK